MVRFFSRVFSSAQSRRPVVGEPVWWAPKQLGCQVTAVLNGIVTFQSKRLVKNKKGREVPRWTVSSGAANFLWRPDLGMWVIGQGPMPRNPRGMVITPEPVQLSGQATGSFAVKE